MKAATFSQPLFKLSLTDLLLQSAFLDCISSPALNLKPQPNWQLALAPYSTI